MLKAMVVDDDRNVCEGLTRMIPWEDLGYTLVGCASNGDDGYKMALENEPDVVISDVIMPVLDGTQLCCRIMETMSGTSFIFISAYENFSSAQIAMSKNVHAYIVKPITRQKLDYISQCLTEIREKAEHIAFYKEILFSEAFQEKMNSMLGAGDSDGIRSVFDRIVCGIKYVDEDGILSSVCARLIRILFQHMERFGLGAENSGAYSDALEQIGRMKFKSDMIMYAADLYKRTLADTAQSKPHDNITVVMAGIKEYIDNHYSDQTLSCMSLAEEFHYSPGYISKMFNQKLGTTPSEYIMHVRLKKACYMLSYEDKQISQIAETTGFGNANYFTKVFRRKMHISPTRYRLTHSGKTKQ